MFFFLLFDKKKEKGLLIFNIAANRDIKITVETLKVSTFFPLGITYKILKTLTILIFLFLEFMNVSNTSMQKYMYLNKINWTN